MADNEQNVNPELENDAPQGEQDESIETSMERFFFHQRRALEETGKALEALLPPDFRKHAGVASNEFARGFRVLVDMAIDQIKEATEREDEEADEIKDDNGSDDDEPPSTTGKTKVRVKLD